MTATGSKKCGCGRTISATASTCRDCSSKPTGCLEILNVQGGDVRIGFDKANPQEVIRAKRIIQDMLRRGYALIVEVERNGERAYERVQSFDAEKGEYIIADFDPVVAEKTDRLDAARIRLKAETAETSAETEEEEIAAAPPPGPEKPTEKPKRGRPPKRGLPMENTKATAVGRSAGG